MYIAAISVHSLILAVLHFIKCINSDWRRKNVNEYFLALAKNEFRYNPDCASAWSESSKEMPTPWTVILLVCLVFEGLLFAIFTMIMFGVQVQAIWNDETGIEQLKKETGISKRRSWKSFRSVFGKGFTLNWFSPFTRPMVGGKVIDSSGPYLYDV